MLGNGFISYEILSLCPEKENRAHLPYVYNAGRMQSDVKLLLTKFNQSTMAYTRKKKKKKEKLMLPEELTIRGSIHGDKPVVSLQG